MSDLNPENADHLHAASTESDLHVFDAAPGDDLAFTTQEASGAAERLAGMEHLDVHAADVPRPRRASTGEDHLHAGTTDADLHHSDAGPVDDLAFTADEVEGAARRFGRPEGGQAG